MNLKALSPSNARRRLYLLQGAARSGLYGAVAAIITAIGGSAALWVLSFGSITPETLWPQGLLFQVTVGMSVFGALLAAGIWLLGQRRR